MNIDFFKSLYNSDIIYHYTKASIAIDHILFNNQLKFTASKNSTDPIESSKAKRGTVSYRVDIDESQKTHEEAEKLHELLEVLESGFHQICFCKNTLGELFGEKNYYTQFKGHEELFGFAKPRMWDQYGDKYTGVCIAFSKKRILALNKKLDLIDNDIEYLSYQDLSVRKVGNIQIDHLSDKGYDFYRSQLEKQIKEAVFCKHKDYSDECEYRVGLLFDKENCIAEQIKGEWIFYKTMMLDISNCIEAIFVSSYANKKQKKDLLNYANLINKPVVEIRWLHNTFECINYKENEKFWKQLIKK